MAKITKRMKISTITSVILILSFMISSQNIAVNQNDLREEDNPKPSPSPTIEILANGAVYPNDGRIIQVTENKYIFNLETIQAYIIIRRSNVELDGMGRRLIPVFQESYTRGVQVSANLYDVTIKNIFFDKWVEPIAVFDYSHNIYITGNTMTLYKTGITNPRGVWSRNVQNMEIYENTINGPPEANNIVLEFSENNKIYHNNFHCPLIEDIYGVNNKWYDTVNLEGNYWADYTGADNDGDGIGDTLIPHLGVDPYPFMDPDGWIYNAPPIADAGVTYEGTEGATVTFDASGSYDPEGDPLQYRWDFDNNAVWDTDWSSSPSADNTWIDDYTGTIVLEVSDGNTPVTDTATITVNNVAPSVNAGSDQTADEGDAVSFIGSFTDPGADTHTFVWDFDDGTTESGTLTPTHSYDTLGTYVVRLEVTDDDGGIGFDTCQVNVIESLEWILDPFVIDDSGSGAGDFTWAEAVLEDWCTGGGSEPYILQNIFIDGGSTSTCIEIRNSNVDFIIRDCTLSNSGTSGAYYAGIYLDNVENGIITENYISDNIASGVYLENSDNNIISNNYFDETIFFVHTTNSHFNIISGNDVTGGELRMYWSNFNEVTGNILVNSMMSIEYCDFNLIADNEITHDWIAIILSMCESNTLSGNLMIGTGISISGSIQEKDSHTIDTSNLVNGKPLYYYVNEDALGPTDFTDAGQIIMVNCNDCVISGLSISQSSNAISIHFGDNNEISDNEFSFNTRMGIFLWYTTSTTITGNTVTNNLFGMALYGCTYTNLINNIANDNGISGYDGRGVYLWQSDFNTISMNEITSNLQLGIHLEGSQFNEISGNNIGNSGYGIYLSRYQPTDTYSNNNVFSGNQITDHTYYGFYISDGQQDNLINDNSFIGNAVNARDDGTQNLWDDGAIGNYWDDYPYVDADDDGIGDMPFSIPGAALSQDNFPIWDDGPGIPDTVPPITEISFEEIIGPEGWYTTDVTVTLSATDNSAGVAETKYRIDGVSWLIYDFPFTISKEGDTLIEFYSIDNFGNTESIKSSEFKIVKAPEVEAGADQTVNEGASVIFGGSYTDPGDTSVHTIFWDFGDGNTATGTLNPTHEYEENGIFTVTLTVEDGFGGVGTDTLIVTVDNVAPMVDAGLDQTADEGAVVNFGGSFTDPGADTFTIEWDFGDNTAFVYGTLTPTHTYADNGVYTVTLTVTDDDGGVGIDTLTVTVDNVAPTLSGLSATSIDEGSFSTLSGTINDPSILDTFTLTVDWGDGSSPESIDFPSGTTAFSLTHQYLDDDIYTVALTVIDDDGGSGTGNLIVTVTNVAPILTISGDPDVDEGSLYTLYLDSYDPGDDYIYQWIIDWGDGYVDTIAGDPSTATHVYADGFNAYIISAIVSDEDGTYTNFGFELGDFTDWDVYIPPGGSANVVNAHTGYLGTSYSPMGGSYFALLKTDGAGSYSTLQMTFDLLAGQVISGWAAFDARDYNPYNDNAAVRILDEFGVLIDTVWYCDVSIVGNYGDSPWEQWSWTAPTSGNYIIEYRIANSRDSVLDSYALFDEKIEGLNVVVNNIAPTLTLSGSLEVDEGSIYVLNLDSYDPGDDTIFQWVINWGDGFVDTITEYPSSVTHTYADGPNAYIISAIVSDEDGTYGLLGPNSGFEMGDFATWDVYIPPGGSANVVNAHTGYLGTSYSPMGGNYFALLKTDGAGSYSTLQMTFDLLAGQIISGWAAFDARDYSPYNDNAAVRILDEFGVLIDTVWYCDVSIVGNYGDSPWEQWSWTAPTSGNYIIEYRIANSRDSVLDSFALFDSEFVSLPLILTVNNVVPTVDAGPDLIVDEDTTYPYLWSFTDPGILDTHTAVIYWGDGSTEVGTIVDNNGDGTVSGVHMYVLPGFYTVTITVTDKDGGVGSDTLIVEVLDITPPISTLLPQDPYYEEGGIYYVSTATLFSFSAEDGEMNFGSGLLQYRLDDDVDWIEYEGSEMTFTVTEIGPHTVYYRSIDVAGNEEEIKSIEIVVNASELTYLVGFEGTYSDPVNLEAYLMDIATGLPIPGKTIVFTLGTQTVSAVTLSDGIAYATLILDQPGGFYTVSASFAEDEEYLGSDSEICEFTIYKEYAYAEYTGDMVVPLDAETITLRATVFDEDDGNWGDLTKIYVNITILDSTTLIPLDTYEYILKVEVTIVKGVGVARVTILNDLKEGSYLVQISFDLDENDYYWGYNSIPVALIIYEPTGDFVTGGGWIEDTNGNKGNFGFNVKYKKNGLPKGQAIYIYREGEYVFIVKANAWVGMAIISDENYAIFEAKCNVKKIHAETGVIVWEEGNYRLIIEVWDNSEDGKEDVFQLHVYDKIGLLYHEAGFDPHGLLGGGNIVIHINKKK